MQHKRTRKFALIAITSTLGLVAGSAYSANTTLNKNDLHEVSMISESYSLDKKDTNTKYLIQCNRSKTTQLWSCKSIDRNYITEAKSPTMTSNKAIKAT